MANDIAALSKAIIHIYKDKVHIRLMVTSAGKEVTVGSLSTKAIAGKHLTAYQVTINSRALKRKVLCYG